jgi:hypothetical protein
MLTKHFAEKEFAVLGCEARIVENARFLCERILEPLRIHFGVPVVVNSGYRNPEHNKAVGGKPGSWHLFKDGKSAADVVVAGVDVVLVFEWLRLESGLPFDRVIMETNKNGVPVIVHIQVDRNNVPARLGFIGATGDSKSYDEVKVV